MRFIYTDATRPQVISFYQVMRLLNEPEDQLKRLFLGEVIEVNYCLIEMEKEGNEIGDKEGAAHTKEAQICLSGC